MMNAIDMTNTAVITANDIAKATGFAVSTVYGCLGKRASIYSKKTVSKVREMAKILNYDPKLTRKLNGGRKGRKWTTSTSGNFADRKEETDRMLQLREQGYTNAEIAAKVGVSVQTVLNRIGTQPQTFTQMSFTLRGERQRRRNAARRDAIMKAKIEAFRKLREEVEKQESKAAELECEAQRIADEARFMRGQLDAKVVTLAEYRREAELASKTLGVSLG